MSLKIKNESKIMICAESKPSAKQDAILNPHNCKRCTGLRCSTSILSRRQILVLFFKWDSRDASVREVTLGADSNSKKWDPLQLRKQASGRVWGVVILFGFYVFNSVWDG